jgi:hypothetical protein
VIKIGFAICINDQSNISVSWSAKSQEQQDFEFQRAETKVRINVNRKQLSKEIKDSVFQIDTAK